MISTVQIRRESTAHVVVEHPDEWDDAQILAAVKNRAIDIAAEAPMWRADNRTTIGGVEVGADHREEMESEGMDMAMQHKPVELTEDDLDSPAEPEIESTTDDEEEQDA